MQAKRLFLTITILFSLLFSSLSQARNVSIPDANLAAAIRQEIGNSITTDTLLNLKRLEARNSGIKDLTGLEHAHNLEELNLSGEYIEGEGTVNSNTISDFSPVAGLTNLKWLYLSDCSISDIAFLAKLTQLTYLNLTSNPISDVSPLAGLTQLRLLNLYNTSVSDVSALSSLTQLTNLGISGTVVSDVSALAGLAQLTYLYLGWNAISDISALSDLRQLKVLNLRNNAILDVSPLVRLDLMGTEWNSTGLSIESNPLSYTSIYTHIPAMQRKGIEVGFDSRTPTTLTKRLGDAQQAKPRMALATPLIVEVTDEKNMPFAGVPIEFTVTTGGGKVNPAKTVSDTTGSAETTLTLGTKLVKNTVRVTAAKIRQPVIFTATATDNPPPTFRKPITFSITENTTAVGTVKATDADNQDSVTGYAISPTAGEDSALFSITPKGVLRFKTAPDYERPTTSSRSNVYTVLVSATSGTGKRERTGTQPFIITVTDVDEPPDRPAAPTVIPATPTSLIVSWAPPANTGPPMTYEVRYREGNTGQFIKANYNGIATNFTLSGLTSEKNYQAQVRAKNAEGTSPWSPSGIGTPKASPPIDFPDTALRVKIAEALGKRRNATITAVDMLALTELHAPNANIRNLTGIQHAHNLRDLDLGGEYIEEEQRNSYNNAVSDLSPLQGLTQLTRLDLSGNDVSNVSLLSGLTALTSLRLYNNPISDVAPLAELTQLMDLSLPNTQVSDVAPLVGLIQLTHLNLSNTRVSNVAPLAGLTQLRNLRLSSTPLSDIAALSSLTQLTSLGIGNNDLADLSPLEGLTQLVDLSLWNNAISDLSPLKGLTQLTYLYLSSNDISDLSPLSGLRQLMVLNLSYNAILDVSPLVRLDLPGTEWNSTGLDIRGNPLSYASINTHIPAMQAKGIGVEFDARVPTMLLRISDTAQEGVVNTALPLPFVVEVLDQEDHTFAGVPVKFAVAAGRGRLNATTVKTDAVGRAAAHLTLGRTEGTTTVRATATAISEPVQFTATAILRSSPVMIPDVNLRTKIMETLRRPLDEAPTASDMLTLTTLTANNANIYDLTGLQHAANLTTLSLNNNYITEGAPLAALTQLTELSLNNNNLWSLEPLTGLTELTTLSLEYNSLSDIKPLTVLPQLKTLHLRGNWLDNSAFDRHIPAMQMKGIDIRFDPRTKDPRPVVRIIYFYPSDREPLPDIDERMDRLIKDAQQFYADQMKAHGFDRKTFLFETDTQGRAVIHHVKGRFSHRDYQNDWGAAWQEATKRFDRPDSFLFTVLDVDLEGITPCGRGGGNGRAGGGFVTARECSNVSTIAHELGHAFGLQHDYTRTDGKWIRSKYSSDRMMTSFCAAEWLDVIPIFNTGAAPINHNTTIKILPPNLASPPNIMRLSFEVNDLDGIQQVQFFTNELSGWAGLGPGYPNESTELADYKGLKGNPDYTGEFFTTQVKQKNKVVIFRSIDVHGNMTWQELPVDITSLLPPPKVVLIPDPHLASVVRDEISNITTHTILDLTALDVRNQGITDLTGLEHAHNLKRLDLSGEYIDGGGWANSNAVSDFSPLVGLRQLTYLGFSRTGISNISELADLTQLTELHLSDNNISNISPLTGLTQLTSVNLSGNEISDISALSGLTQLTNLYLDQNAISDISALSGLTQLTFLGLSGNEILDVSPLSGLTQLTDLSLDWNAISDISALSGLTQLTSVNLSGNEISDISVLSDMTQLTRLTLAENTITDVSVLSGLTQLTRLDLRNNSILDVSPLVKLNLTGTEWDSTGLYIERNPLSYASIHTHIPAMQAKGIEVQFDFRKPTRLFKISGAAQQGVVNTALPLPFIVEVRDEQNRAFAGVPVTFSVATGGGKLSVTTVPTDAAGRASAHLTLGRTIGTTTVRVAAAEIARSAQFTATAVLLSAPVTVSDVALHAEIASALGKSPNSKLTVSDMLKLTTLAANSANIRELTGLEHASNLTTLSLNGNNLSNIAPLAGLSKLTTLALNNNNISDVAPLAGLAHLQTLSLENNNLADVTPLSGLTQLKTLSLDNNRLWNVFPLKGLSELQTLSLNNNDLSDIALLTPLTQLNTLQLRGNLLSYPSLHTHILAIQAQGATVAVDLRTPTTLVKASGTHGVAGEAFPVIVEVQDEQGLGFSGVPVTFTVTAGGGHLSASNIISDSIGRARTTLTLGITPGKNTVRATAVEVQQPALLGIIAVNANSPVTIPDANLRAKVVESLGKPINVELTAGDMLLLTKLEAPNANIRDITGLQHAHNLRELYLDDEYIDGEGNVNSNTISDFSPIAGLTQLTHLNLSSCAISDVSFLSDLTQLTTLQLYSNPISDIAALVGLTQLTFLELSETTISDVSPLAELTRLRGLYLFNTSISDVSALSGLAQLKDLGVSGNEISDVSPLAGLTQLTSVYLGWNDISDISVLTGLTQLVDLNLSGNEISDVSALAGLTQLTYLNLDRNAISDISALSDLTQLKVLNLRNNTILDVSPLVGLDLPGTEWDSTGLYIENNPLSYASINTHIPAMQAKGVKVSYNLGLAKIAGPWLWMIAPTERWQGGARAINVDSLAAVSAGAVTEAEVAANGAKEGDTVGDYTWKLGRIAWDGGNNINDLLNTIGMAEGDINDHSSYALITLESATAQSDVPMKVGSDDAIKVWLNGKVVHNHAINRGASDFQDDFTVDLEKGDNLLLVKVSERDGGWSMFVGIEADVNAVYKRPPDTVVAADVNSDGIVNIQDLVLVSSSLGQTGQSSADVNGDGVVNIQDLVMVAGALGQGTAASPTLHPSDLEGLTAAEVQNLLAQARQMALTDSAYLRGIAVLEQLLALLLPKETALLPNYPNPFNPETWIPYQLSEPAEVTLHIYAVDGRLVRALALGHQSAGKYQARSRAAHWDGRNSFGEAVASGVYFYTLTAGDFTATRKMLIRK